MPHNLTAQQQLADLIEQGRNAHSVDFRQAPGMSEPHVYFKRSPVVADVISLSGATGTDTPSARMQGARDGLLPATSGKVIPMAASIMARSRVAQAGTTIVLQEPISDAIPTGAGKEVIYPNVKRRVTLLDPAQFGVVIDGDAVPVTPHSVNRKELDFGQLGHSYAVRREFTRRDFVEFGVQQLSREVWDSLEMGLPRAADHSLMTALLGGSTLPPAFSLGAAAATGIEFTELRALVGTAGAGAAVGQDGVLRAGGVLAEFTPVMAHTVVGAFNRAVVAVFDDLRVVVERIGKDGTVAVTLFVDLQPVTFAREHFWLAAA